MPLNGKAIARMVQPTYTIELVVRISGDGLQAVKRVIGMINKDLAN